MILLKTRAESLQRLGQNGFSQVAIDAIDHLTRREEETYYELIERVKGNPIAVKIKLADLEDNMDASRLKELPDSDRKRLDKYQQARQALGQLI